MSRLSLTGLPTFLLSTMRVLWMELRGLRLRGPRAVLAMQSISSVLLALLIADVFNMRDRWWVAISAYVVMRADWRTSLTRAVQRMAGTIGGAIVAAVAAPFIIASPLLYSLSLAAVAAIGVFRALGSVRSYGWLLATITALLVLSDARYDSHIYLLAMQRVADVAVGTLACLIVAGVVPLARHYLRRPSIPVPEDIASSASASSKTAAPLKRSDWPIRRLRAGHALQGAVTVALLTLIDYRLQFRDFPQTLVTIAVVLVIPLRSLVRQQGDDNAVAMRMANRTLGCLLAAACAFALLPLIGDRPLLFLLCLSLGIWLASHVQSGNPTTSYIGTQFGIAFLMVFVQDNPWSTDVSAAALRLLGILTGVLALGVVMLICAWLSQQWRTPRGKRSN